MAKAAKKPATWQERARHVAGGARFYVDKARALLEDTQELRDALEQYSGFEPSDALETLSNAVVALNDAGEFRDGERIANLFDELSNLLPEGPLVDAFVEAHDELLRCVEQVEEYRDDPSSADADQKEEARDEARAALETFADTLDDLEQWMS